MSKLYKIDTVDYEILIRLTEKEYRLIQRLENEFELFDPNFYQGISPCDDSYIIDKHPQKEQIDLNFYDFANTYNPQENSGYLITSRGIIDNEIFLECFKANQINEFTTNKLADDEIIIREIVNQTQIHFNIANKNGEHLDINKNTKNFDILGTAKDFIESLENDKSTCWEEEERYQIRNFVYNKKIIYLYG